MSPTDALLGILGAITLIAPGWLAARTCRLPLPLLAGFVFGVVLFVTALGAWLAGRMIRLRPFRFWTTITTIVRA